MSLSEENGDLNSGRRGMSSDNNGELGCIG